MRLYGTENNIIIMKELGERLRQTRIASEYTQADIAERAGLSKRTVERIESGDNQNLFSILNLMRALDLLSHLEVVIPEQQPSPEMLFKYGKTKKRVRKKEQSSAEGFIWGDDLN